jgi:hypothetical protein
MNFLDFMELSSQKYTILPYPEPVESILQSVGIAKVHPGSPHYSYHKARDTAVGPDLKTLAGSRFIDSLQIK